MQTLRRTRVGPFTVDDAVTLETDPNSARTRLRPLEEAVAELPRMIVADEEVRRLRQGQALLRDGLDGAELAVFDAANRLVATAMWDAEKGMIRPDKVFGAIFEAAPRRIQSGGTEATIPAAVPWYVDFISVVPTLTGRRHVGISPRRL